MNDPYLCSDVRSTRQVWCEVGHRKKPSSTARASQAAAYPTVERYCGNHTLTLRRIDTTMSGPENTRWAYRRYKTRLIENRFSTQSLWRREEPPMLVERSPRASTAPQRDTVLAADGLWTRGLSTYTCESVKASNQTSELSQPGQIHKKTSLNGA